MNQRDRLGDRLQGPERDGEERYCARRDRELIARLRAARGEEAESLLREMSKMRCPRCGQRLKPGTFQGIGVAECPECRGMWLDRGKLKGLAEG